MKTAAYLVLAYGLFIFLGGMIGFAKAHSMASLISGILFAVIIIVSAVAMLKDYRAGFYAALATSGFLTAFFVCRFTSSYKFMPAGLMFILSAAIFTFLTVSLCKCGCGNKDSKI